MDNPAARCINCNLCESRQQVVWGKGNPNADIMLIGEAPGRNEDVQGVPFIGRSGNLLDSLLGQASLSRASIYITNTVKCRPPDNRDPTPREIEACHPWLQLEMAIVQPVVVLVMGKHASHLAFPQDTRVPVGISAIRSIAGRRCVVLGTYHPAYALRNPTGGIADIILRDVKRAKTYGRELRPLIERLNNEQR